MLQLYEVHEDFEVRCLFFSRFELKSLFIHYKGRVEFIEGTPVKDTDLDRVSAKVASAFYLLADQQAKVIRRTSLNLFRIRMSTTNPYGC